MNHEKKTIIGQSDEWLTPRSILQPLGKFDLDPCSPIKRPWDTATQHYTINDNGLILPWDGRVWLNPPYGDTMIKWLKKMAEHDNGIALTFARTDTKQFHQWIFPHAISLLFLQGRINFCTVDGRVAKDNSGAPSVLIAYGEQNTDVLADCGLAGRHILINAMPVITVVNSPDWKSVVNISLIRLNGKASLDQIYKMVEVIAPDKIAKNGHYKEKVRQKLQKYFHRIERGNYTLFNQN